MTKIQVLISGIFIGFTTACLISLAMPKSAEANVGGCGTASYNPCYVRIVQ